jgi:hypothetical protein
MKRESPQEPISDTVHIRPDGAIVVDVPKLLRKEHIRRMMKDIRSKSRTVPEPESRNGHNRP